MPTFNVHDSRVKAGVQQQSACSYGTQCTLPISALMSDPATCMSVSFSFVPTTVKV
jgi:hypothetical protein